MQQPLTTNRTTRPTPATSARLRTQRVPLIRREIVWKPLQHPEIPLKRWLDRSCPSLANIGFLQKVLESCLDRPDVLESLRECIIDHLPKASYVVSIPQAVKADPAWGCFGSEFLKQNNYDKAILQAVEEVTAESIVCSSAKYCRIHLAKDTLAVTNVEPRTDEKDVAAKSETSSRNLSELYNQIYRHCRERFPHNDTTCELMRSNGDASDDWGVIYSSLMTYNATTTYKVSTWRTKILLRNLLTGDTLDNHMADADCSITIKSNMPEADNACAVDVDLHFSITRIPLSRIVAWVSSLESDVQRDLTEFLLAWTFVEEQPYARALHPNTMPDVVALAAELKSSQSANTLLSTARR